MQNDPREQHEQAEDVSFADILKEFESAKQPARQSTGNRTGRGRGKNRQPVAARRGTVVGFSGDFVLVDYGEKSEGMIPAADLRDAEGKLSVSRGDAIDVSVTGFNSEGMATLSRILGPRPRDWDALQRA